MATLKLEPRALALLVGFVCTAGCGDPQRDELYRGPSIWSARIGLQRAGTSADNEPSLQIAMFYSPGGPNIRDLEQLVEHRGTTLHIDALSPTTLNMFEPPHAEHMLRLPDGSDAGYALGRVLMYGDDDLDGRHTPGEPFLGTVASLAYLYLPEPLPAERSPTGYLLDAGFQNLFFPQACGKLPPTPTDAGTCGVALGASCQVDADCTGGLCLHATNLPWPAGYCTIPASPSASCRPAQGVFMSRLQNGLTPAVAKTGLYLRPCQTHAECARSASDTTFRCDPGLKGCVPNVGDNVLKVGVAFEIEPFCAL